MLYIWDIYAGKSDAKDEIAVSGDDLFFSKLYCSTKHYKWEGLVLSLKGDDLHA